MAKKTFYILVVGIIGIIVLGITSLARANRNENTPASHPNTAANQAIDTATTIQQPEPTSTPERVSIPATDTPIPKVSSTPIPENTTVIDHPAVDLTHEPQIKIGDQPADLMETVAYLRATIQAHFDVSGWIYYKREVIDYKKICDNGISLFPDHYVSEVWYHVNEDKLVFEMVTMDKSMDGVAFQTGVSHDGKSWNSFSGKTIDSAPSNLGVFDGEILDRYLEFATTNPHTIELAEINGLAVVKITGTEMFSEPVTMDCYEKRLNGMVAINYFDADTGRLVQSESIVLFEDGSKENFSKVTVDIQLNVTPPAEITQLLSEH